MDLNSRWRIPLVTTEKCKLRHAGSGLSRLPLTKKWNWNSAGTCSWSTDWWMEPWPPATKRVEVLHLFRWFTHTHTRSFSQLLQYRLSLFCPMIPWLFVSQNACVSFVFSYFFLVNSGFTADSTSLRQSPPFSWRVRRLALSILMAIFCAAMWWSKVKCRTKDARLLSRWPVISADLGDVTCRAQGFMHEK